MCGCSNSKPFVVEGPQGPEGPIGPQGPAGTNAVIINSYAPIDADGALYGTTPQNIGVINYNQLTLNANTLVTNSDEAEYVVHLKHLAQPLDTQALITLNFPGGASTPISFWSENESFIKISVKLKRVSASSNTVYIIFQQTDNVGLINNVSEYVTSTYDQTTSGNFSITLSYNTNAYEKIIIFQGTLYKYLKQ